jgi:hypothetical protein
MPYARDMSEDRHEEERDTRPPASDDALPDTSEAKLPDAPLQHLSPRDEGSKAQHDQVAEALLGISLSCAIGVFALPFTISLPVRVLVGALTFIFLFYVLARFPSATKAIQKILLESGPVLLAILAVILIILIIHPSIRSTKAALRLMTAGATAIAFDLPRSWRNIRYHEEWFMRGRGFHVVAIGIFSDFLFGVVGWLAIRVFNHGVQITASLLGSAITGIASYAVFNFVRDLIYRRFFEFS